jgi:ribosomal protein L11 methyltransferase
MKYLAAKFTIQCEESMLQVCRDLVADAAGMANFESFEDTAEGINGYVQESLFDKEILSQNLADFPIEGAKISYTISPVEDQDWNATWEEEGFESIDIDGKINIFDARHDTAKDSFPINIGIEAREAFGTGTHWTTRMIVSALLHLDIKGKSVLDCGCGTGILGIAAMKLGAENVIGYDIDEWSANNTELNAANNDVKFSKVICGDSSVIECTNEKFDIVLANINRNILLADMPRFAKAMKPNGTLILSGFYESDVPMLLEKASSLGLHEEKRTVDNEWTMLLLK